MRAAGARIPWARGCVLGAACGDALGAPFEGAAEVDAARLAAWAASPEPLRYTDDTAMMLTLAEYLADAVNDFDETELVRRFALAWKDEPWRGYGAGPPAIFRRVLAGWSWEDAARSVFPGGSFGNGGAMRVAPVGVLDMPVDQIAALARRTAQVTHAHPLALDGAAVQAVGVALACLSNRTEPVDTEDFLATVESHVSTAAFAVRLHVVADLVGAAAAPADVAVRLGNDVRAMTSAPAALTAFLREPDDVPAAIGFALCIGGDTDTIAAMTGALVGARNGEEALPATWLARLEHRERLSSVAARLCR
jgi:poly(ADP-ribose) glycohydrolase ARH3